MEQQTVLTKQIQEFFADKPVRKVGYSVLLPGEISTRKVTWTF